MSNRQPGDYVVNSELTQQQIQRFVADCVEDGAVDDEDWEGSECTWLYPREQIVPSVGCGMRLSCRSRGQNVTHEYKDQTMTKTPDLPTVLEECAEHLRAGRDPYEYFEISAWCNDPNDEAGWVQPDSVASIISFAVNHHIRRKPQTITINGVEVPAPDRVKGDLVAFGQSGEAISEINIELTYAIPIPIEKAQSIIKALRGEQ